MIPNWDLPATAPSINKIWHHQLLQETPSTLEELKKHLRKPGANKRSLLGRPCSFSRKWIHPFQWALGCVRCRSCSIPPGKKKKQTQIRWQLSWTHTQSGVSGMHVSILLMQSDKCQINYASSLNMSETSKKPENNNTTHWNIAPTCSTDSFLNYIKNTWIRLCEHWRLVAVVRIAIATMSAVGAHRRHMSQEPRCKDTTCGGRSIFLPAKYQFIP